MFSIDNIQSVLAGLALIFGIAWLLLTMHVLHYSEKEHGRFKGWMQFWSFYEEMKVNYPESSRAGTALFLISGSLALLWLLLRIIGGS